MTGRVVLNAGERPNITEVLVGLDKPSPNTSYFANMYFGTCSAPGEVAYKLSKVENGRSVTNLPLAFQLFIDENGAAYRGPYAILVSRTANPGSSLACGDLKGPDRAPIQKPSPDKQGSGKADARSIDLVGSNGTTLIGKAWLNAAGPSKSRLTVKLNQPHPNASYSANIYYGVCTDPSGEAAFKLNNVQNGRRGTVSRKWPVESARTANP